MPVAANSLSVVKVLTVGYLSYEGTERINVVRTRARSWKLIDMVWYKSYIHWKVASGESGRK